VIDFAAKNRSSLRTPRAFPLDSSSVINSVINSISSLRLGRIEDGGSRVGGVEHVNSTLPWAGHQGTIAVENASYHDGCVSGTAPLILRSPTYVPITLSLHRFISQACHLTCLYPLVTHTKDEYTQLTIRVINTPSGLATTQSMTACVHEPSYIYVLRQRPVVHFYPLRYLRTTRRSIILIPTSSGPQTLHPTTAGTQTSVSA
jgi:hypothetical protein